jgi:hypothetical protein
MGFFYCLCLWLFIALRADMSKQNFVWTPSVWKRKEFSIRAYDFRVARSLNFLFLLYHRAYWKFLSTTRKYVLYFFWVFFPLKVLLVEVGSVTNLFLLNVTSCHSILIKIPQILIELRISNFMTLFKEVLIIDAMHSKESWYVETKKNIFSILYSKNGH